MKCPVLNFHSQQTFHSQESLKQFSMIGNEDYAPLSLPEVF